ncbi:spore coat protein, CotS family [Clostridium cavendishii DSM 21758]|uniref:Spore coat protein, CotS family n=1 Tax=Clostridium cavendishii DSM 21758 TaxID=1121302 RepID=A0A1M6U7K7_9CLOT|nr:CotS family spore coat protein [Clostridium cavendishii]SHK65058.1 spore coat protein, CotS family [Clostridium cavendishii DSM 21758]
MIRIKYGDKKYLCKYDLHIELFEKLGVDIIDLYPTRSVYVLTTKTGKKILKLIDYEEEKVLFINKVLNSIRKKFNNVLNINELKDGELVLRFQNERYILLDLIEGIECNLANPIDLEITSKALAKLHVSSRDFCSNEITKNEEIEYSNLFKKPFYFNNAKKDLIKMKAQVESCVYKNEFDKLFLRDIDYYKKEILECMRLIENSKYSELCLKEEAVSVCHNDLAYHNIIISNNEAYFIDFDYLSIDLKVWDLANFINKTVKRFGFDIDMCKSIIQNYNLENPISKEELENLYIFLKFPHDFYIASRDYYFKLKDWEEDVFINRFTTKIGYKEERENFLKCFKNEYLDK